MNLRPHFRTRCVSLLGVVMIARAAAVPAVPPDPVIELPKFVVTDRQKLPPPESWRYAKIPGFEVLTNASNADTLRFLRDFQTLQEVMDVVWPTLRQAAPPLPTSLIVFGHSKEVRDFLHSKIRVVGDETIDFQPLAFEGEAPAVLPPGAPGNHRVASGFYADEENACIVIHLGGTGTGLDDPYRQFYGEYVKYLVARMDPLAPLWLRAGLGQLFAGVDFTDKWIGFGQIGSGAQRAGDFTTLLGNSLRGKPGEEQKVSGGAFPSLAELLRADEVRLLDGRYQALAYEFVHMCLYGRGKQFQKPLLSYLARLKGEPATEAVFQECFGCSIRKMQDELQQYAAFTDYKWVEMVAQKGRALKPPPDAVLRDATQAEIGRIKGQGLMLAGRRDSARVALIAPYIRAEQDPDLLAVLGLFETGSAKPERARQFLELAVAGHTGQPGAYLALARMRYAEQRAASAGPLDEQRREVVLSPLRAAATLPVSFGGVYELMADVWLGSAARPTVTDLNLLDQGVRRFPRQLRLVYQTALLCSESGFPKRAASLADWGRKSAQEPADRERFAQLQVNLPAVPAAGK